jgi:TCP-1/cpn60 chaperonin family
VRKAISWPARQIAINAGEDDSIVVGKILEKNTYAYGYDAQAGEYGNLISKDIIDPTKVVRAALQGAASVAGLLITTEAMVAELPKKQGPAMPGGPGGGMGGMGGMDFGGSSTAIIENEKVLGTNLIYPGRQRFHDDDPAGKLKSGIVVGSGPLFFDGPDLFANFIRPRDPVQRLVQQR